MEGTQSKSYPCQLGTTSLPSGNLESAKMSPAHESQSVLSAGDGMGSVEAIEDIDTTRPRSQEKRRARVGLSVYFPFTSDWFPRGFKIRNSLSESCHPLQPHRCRFCPKKKRCGASSGPRQGQHDDNSLPGEMPSVCKAWRGLASKGIISMLGLHCPPVDGCAITADLGAREREDSSVPVAQNKVLALSAQFITACNWDCPRTAFTLRVLSAPRHPGQAKGAGQRCL